MGKVRNILLGLGAAAALAFSPAAAGAAAPKPTNQEIVKQIEKLEIQVIKAHTLDDFRTLFDQDVEYYTPSYYSRGFGNFLKDAQLLYPNVDGWDVKILDMHIIATDSMATATSVQVWNSTFADTHQPAIRHFYRQTNVWQKKPEGWRVVQAHISVPIDPLTERILCLDPVEHCALPNFPHRSLNTEAVRARNAEEVKIYNPGRYTEGQYKIGD